MAISQVTISLVYGPEVKDGILGQLKQDLPYHTGAAFRCRKAIVDWRAAEADEVLTDPIVLVDLKFLGEGLLPNQAELEQAVARVLKIITTISGLACRDLALAIGMPLFEV